MKSKMWFMSNAGQPACDIIWITFLPSMSLYAVPFSFGFKADLSQSTLIINMDKQKLNASFMGGCWLTLLKND